MAFRNITPIEIKSTIPIVIGNEARNENNASVKSGSKLIIETSLLQEEEFQYKPQQPAYVDLSNEVLAKLEASAGKPATSTKLSALDKIRKQVKGNNSNGNSNGHHNKPLEKESLQAAWDEYVNQLKEAKSPAATNFEMAELSIQDENSFIALVSNNIQLRFIEQNGQKASQFLREKLQNNLLQFYIVMVENKEQRIPADTPLTSREQFLKMAEQYPFVKELKERLRLELDY